MPARRRILTLSMLGVAAALAYLFATTPWPNDEFAVLGKPTVIESPGIRSQNEASGTLTAGLGMHSGGPVSNAFVAAAAAVAHEAGSYSAGGTRFDPHGELESWSVQFREGPWTEVDASVIERTVRTPLGIEFVSYRVRICGALSAGGAQWCYRPQISGHGRGPDFSVIADLQYEPAQRTLELQLIEKLGSRQPKDYRIRFTVHLDGSLTRAD